jgi:UDP:flavonoid glycosyltransferase YjiC (YdhE family)
LRLPMPFVMIFDFVGTDAMTRRVPDRVGAWILNALWSLDGSVYDRGRHSAIFIGELEDVPVRPFGRGLPPRREHARRHYEVVGHVVRFSPGDYADRLAWRRRSGYGDGPLVVCSIGGTSIGRELLELCGAAAVPLRALVPDARVVLVTGPRIAVDSVTAPEGVDVVGYVPRLHELFASCDVAVVQCGASTTTELAALGRPFVYAPIDGHFEQEIVAARLARHGIGRRMSPRSTSAERLAQMIFEELGNAGSHAALHVDGATRAAQHILAALESG